MNFFLNLKKYTRFLLVFDIFLIFILIYVNIPKTQAGTFNTALILKKNIENIDEIIFTIPDNSLPPRFNELRLIKKKDDFFLNTSNGEYKVQKTLIERFFAILSSKQNFRFVSDDIKQYANFGLDEDHAARIKFLRSDKTIIGEFVFGQNDTLGVNRYVRIDSRTKIFIMPDNIASFLTVKTNFWLDLQIYKNRFEKNLVQAIEKNKRMHSRSGKNEEAFLDLESFLKKFSCIDIYPAFPPSDSGTEEIKLILGSGEEVKILFTPMESGDFILFESGSSNAYVISGYTKRRIDSIFNSIF